jgi:hypothetical protein
MIVEEKSSAPTLANLGGDDKRVDAHEGHAGALPDPLPDPSGRRLDPVIALELVDHGGGLRRQGFKALFAGRREHRTQM